MIFRSRILPIVLGIVSTIAAVSESSTFRTCSSYLKSKGWGVSMNRGEDLLFALSLIRRPVQLDGRCSVEIEGDFAAAAELQAMRLYSAEDENGDGWIRRDEWRLVGEAEVWIDPKTGRTRAVLDDFSVSVFDRQSYYLALMHADSRKNFSEALYDKSVGSDRTEPPLDIHEGWRFDQELREWVQD